MLKQIYAWLGRHWLEGRTIAERLEKQKSEFQDRIEYQRSKL